MTRESSPLMLAKVVNSHRIAVIAKAMRQLPRRKHHR
jgi:hypothetical protein